MKPDPISWIERLAAALGGGAAAVIWAALLIACAFLFMALMRAKDRHLAREAETAASYQAQLSQLTASHAAKLDDIHRAYTTQLAAERDKHLATAVAVIPVSAGLLEMVDDLRVLAQDARERRRSRRPSGREGSGPKTLPPSREGGG